MILRAFFIFIMFLVCHVGTAASLQDWVQKMEANSIQASVGIWALDTGKCIEGHQMDLPLVPASTTKLVSTYAILKTLKPGFQFNTEVWGDLRGATIFGDLIIKGAGDPSLTSERIWLLVSELKAMGIMTITGCIRLDQSIFDGQMFGNGWHNTSADTTPPILPLSVNYNRANGKIVQDPERLAIDIIQKIMRERGISIQGQPNQEGTLRKLITLPSLPLRDLVTTINKISNNFMVEMLVKYFGGGSWPNGVSRIQRFYSSNLNLGVDKIAITDGSGLSKENRISARTLAIILRAVWNDFEVGPEIINSLKVIGGEPWNLSKHSNLARRIRCKTGYLKDVNSICGYLQVPNGQLRVFAIILNGSCSEDNIWELINRWASC